MLGSEISKSRKFRNIVYITFTKCFETSVLPVLEYRSEILGFKEHMKCEWVQQRAACYYFVVHPKAPLLALTGEDMGWKCAQLNRHIKMIKYWNRLINMDYDRLTKKYFYMIKRYVCKIGLV